MMISKNEQISAACAARRVREIELRVTPRYRSVTCAADYDLSKEALWERVENPGHLTGSIPMLADWKADGDLQRGQTGREIHTFFPGVRTPFRWKMISYVRGERWSMFSAPESSTIFDLPHYTEYKVSALGNGARLEITFNAQLRGLFSIRPLSGVIGWTMRRTVRGLLAAIGRS